MGKSLQTEYKRLYLNSLLTDNTECKVYFAANENVKMVYPAITYNHIDTLDLYADNRRFMSTHIFNVMVIDKDPVFVLNTVDTLLDKISFSEKGTSFIKDNLYHSVIVVKI